MSGRCDGEKGGGVGNGVDNQLELVAMPRKSLGQKGSTDKSALLRTCQHTVLEGPGGSCGSRSICNTPGMLWLQLLSLAPAREEDQLCPQDWLWEEEDGGGWRQSRTLEGKLRGKQDRINGAVAVCLITLGRKGETKGRKLPCSSKWGKEAGGGLGEPFG